MPKGIQTSYGPEEEEQPVPTKPADLEELEKKHLELAQKEYEELQRQEVYKKERQKQEAVERLRLANVKRSLEKKARDHSDNLEEFVACFRGMIKVAEKDIALVADAGTLLIDLKALGGADPVNYMLDGAPVPDDAQTYMDRQLKRIITKWRQGAELDAQSIMSAI